MISRRTVSCLGAAQLVSWGTSYYLIGLFGDHIVTATGWSRGFTYGGFSLGLLVMGIASPWVGRAIDKHGGLPVLASGSLLGASGCVVLSYTHHPVVYFLAWIVLGLSMRMTLYDAGFAALARIGGAGARRAMAQITLLGGFASTIFWPLGNALIGWFGWQDALLAYAAFSVAIIPLYLSLRSPQRQSARLPEVTAAPEITQAARYHWMAAVLYASVMALVSFLSSGMSAHMISVLHGLGLGATTAVWVASLRGFGQVAARASELLFGARLSPFTLNFIAASALFVCFLLIPLAGIGTVQTVMFALTFGVGNGLMSITRGTVPLVLLNPSSYGAATGWLLAPSFLSSAAAPIVIGLLIEAWGAYATISILLAVTLLVLGLALALSWKFGSRCQTQ